MDFPYDISPDESLIVYGHVATQGQSTGVYVIGVAPGSEPMYIMPFSPNDADPWGVRFSPDGRRLAYAHGGYYDLGVFDLDAKVERRITFTNGNAQAGDWDPSGRYIVYSRPDLSYGAPDTSAGIFIVDTVTLTDRPLLHDGHPTYGGAPRWSPDSAGVAFWYGTTFQHQGRRSYAIHLYTVRPNGDDYQDLMPTSLNSADSQEWILGQSRIIYESYDPSSYNIHETRVVEADGSATSTWPADLRLMATRISRDGSHYLYTYPDDEGYGVLYIQDTGDVTGATRRQVTHVARSANP